MTGELKTAAEWKIYGRFVKQNAKPYARDAYKDGLFTKQQTFAYGEHPYSVRNHAQHDDQNLLGD